MAENREPPPLNDENDLEKDDDEDIFQSVKEKPQMQIMSQDEDKEDIFADAETEVPLDSPVATPVKENGKIGGLSADENGKFGGLSADEPAQLDSFSTPSAPPASNPFGEETSPAVIDHEPAPDVPPTSKSLEAIKEPAIDRLPDNDVDDESHKIEISVTDPQKRGDGMAAYMAFKVCTKTTLSHFHLNDMSVFRRFSDFLGLHERLMEKHLHKGVIIPPAPEKSVVGMTKIKMSKEDQGSSEFVERRRAALERFMRRLSHHPVLRQDPDFVQFLEQDRELPRSSSTSALSGAGVMRLFSKVGDSINKMTFKMDESDQWFEDKHQEIDGLDHELRKLHSSLETLVHNRKELAANTGQVARSIALLGNSEENTALSRALAQLSEVEEKLDQLHVDQSDQDFFVLTELIKDYIGLVGSVKDVFNERVKVFKTWKESEINVSKKQEEKTKLEQQRKMDKIPAVAQEITKWESKLTTAQEEFDEISKNIRREYSRFEKQRVKDFKTSIINYLENLLNSQEMIVKYWETFLPEAQAIA